MDEVVEDVFDRAEREYMEPRPTPVASRTFPQQVPSRTFPQQGDCHGGYTTVQKKLRKDKAQLALHRKKKGEWVGTKEAWEAEERCLLGWIAAYRDVLAQPYYANKIRKAANRKRRVKRQPLGHRLVKVSPKRARRYSLEELRKITTDVHRAHLPYMVYRIKLKRFKTMKHLAHNYRKPIAWLREAKAKAIADKLITEEEWKKSFRQPGRPRKGAKRGPYRKSVIVDCV